MKFARKHISVFFKLFASLLLVINFGIYPAEAQKVHHHHHRGHRPKNNRLVQYGTASFYSNRFNGKRMANGGIFNNKKMTAAHNSLPLGTYVKITNRANGKWVIVRITDRLHYKNKRLVDLTQAAAKKLAFRGRGLARVKLEVIPPKLMETVGISPKELVAQ